MLSLGGLASRFFGSSNERRVKGFRPKVAAINALEAQLADLSDADLKARTSEFRERLSGGATIDDLLVEAFATVREAAKRTLKQRHFDVQLIGGMVLHQGDIAEMKTGEGKTLVATLPVYLNALAGNGVHVVTVNDYLAKRDSGWMGQVYRFLGLTVGCIVHDLDDAERKRQYACDVTYGTNNEFGFDYLRDNMKMSREEMVQFGFRDFGRALRFRPQDADNASKMQKAERMLQEVRYSLFSYAREEDDEKSRAFWQDRAAAADQSITAAEKAIADARAQLSALNGQGGEAGAGAVEALNHKLNEILPQLRWILGPSGPGDEGERASHAFAIVDEVDSILIDEARTPLIISGPLEDRADLYQAVDGFMKLIEAEDFELDEKQRQVALTEAGNEKMEKVLTEAGHMKGSMYDIENVSIVHHVNQALKAHKLFQRDKDYIIKGGQVVIIDEFTGRMMPGRRYSEGLHQALEAKEHVEIQPENQTLASITFQNYFRLYDKLAGMTGTAMTEANEFMDIYGLEVIEIPTNVPVKRVDEDDEIYRTQREKLAAIVQSIAEAKVRGQPILVGTTSIEKSEQLSELLKDHKYFETLGKSLIEQAGALKAKEEELKKYLTESGERLLKLAKDAKGKGDPIVHQVLNARYHEQEAGIVAQAGVPGAVTIATNMAGRGTDIQLGGNAEYRLRDWIAEERAAGREPDEAATKKKREELATDIAAKKQAALDAGGLYVLATERHESRRIDNQLRGRSGRQGDPGRSKFYLALDDDLMRIFGSERMDKVLQTLGLKEGEAIVHPWMNKSLETAQKKVEQRNFDIRKQILKFDDVMNDQRKVIFEQRLDIMGEDDVSETIRDLRHQLVDELVSKHIPPAAYAEQWDTAGLKEAVGGIFALDLPVQDWAAEEGIADQEIKERLINAVDARATQKEGELTSHLYRQIEKMVLLQTLDGLWREHLVTLEHLRQVIGFRAYGQRDPLNEYKSEAFVLFESMLGRLREATTGQLMNVELVPPDEQPALQPVELPPMEAHHIDPMTGIDEMEPDIPPQVAREMAMADAAMAGARARRFAPPEQPKRQPLQTRKGEGGIDPKDPATWGRVSRNAECPCGSGKKYKHCHGKLD